MNLSDYNPTTGHHRDCVWSEVSFSPYCSEDCTENYYTRVAELEKICDRLAASVVILAYDAHPIYPNTAKWGGGIAGQAITAHCSLTQGTPPGDEWAQDGLPTTVAREWLAGRDIDLEALKTELKTEWKERL